MTPDAACHPFGLSEDFECWFDGPIEPSGLRQIFVPGSLLYLVFVFYGLETTLALPPSQRLMVLGLEVGFGLIWVCLGLFAFRARQQLWVSAEQRRLVSGWVWGRRTIGRFELDLDAIRKVKAGWPEELRRFLPGGGDRQPLTVVHGRFAESRLATLPTVREAEALRVRLEGVIEP